jgi:glycosyltransferase involved in cell wall biosynthesis
MPKVSVIIPTYNRCQLVIEAIGSVLTQSFTDFEIIVIDDGSTDDTAEMVKAVNDERCRYFYKPNGGAASARNMGLTKAGGEYVAFLDSDDLWPKKYLEVMVSTLQDASDYGVAYCGITQVYPDGRIVKNYRVKYCVSGWITESLFNKSYVVCQISVIRRHLLKDFYFDESFKIMSEDVDFFLRLSLRTKFLFVPGVLTIHRVQTDSLSQRGGKNRIDHDKITVLERFYYDLGGKNAVSKATAMKRIGKAYRGIGLQYYEIGARKAAIEMLKRAASYLGFNFKTYSCLIKALLKPKYSDTIPDWNFPGSFRLIKEEKI